jgi:hypothetical protein
VAVGDGVDQLKHKLTDMFSVKWSGSGSNSFVEIAPRAKLENNVDMSACLEGMDEIDNVGVRSKDTVASQLLGFVVDREVDVDFGRSSSRFLGQTFDSNQVIGLQVSSHEDHTEGSMIQGRDGLKSPIKDNAIVESISQAFHDD